MGTDLGSKAKGRVDDEGRRVREDLQVAEVVQRPELRRHEALNTFGELKGQDGELFQVGKTITALGIFVVVTCH